MISGQLNIKNLVQKVRINISIFCKGNSMKQLMWKEKLMWLVSQISLSQSKIFQATGYLDRYPPSTGMTVPVVKPEAGDAR